MEDVVWRGMAVALMAAAMLALPIPAAAQSPVPTPRAPAAGDAARGEQLYQSRCGACHSLDANRVGPRHRDVFGRRVKLPVATGPGDAMIIADAGAYGFSMANAYNLRALPAEDVIENE